jgi:hypothetical protein
MIHFKFSHSYAPGNNTILLNHDTLMPRLWKSSGNADHKPVLFYHFFYRIPSMPASIKCIYLFINQLRL